MNIADRPAVLLLEGSGTRSYVDSSAYPSGAARAKRVVLQEGTKVLRVASIYAYKQETSRNYTNMSNKKCQCQWSIKQKMSMSMSYRHVFDLSLFKYYSYTEWSCILNSLHMICVWLWQIHTHSCYCISKHACHKIFSHALVFNMHHENADCKVKSYFYKMS